MRITIEAEMSPIKGGRAARAPLLCLTGHGFDDTEACAALRRAVTAWCRGLLRVGDLDTVLRRRHITYEATEDGRDIDIRLVVR